MKRILVVDYGVGNLQSVSNALRFLGYRHAVSAQAAALDAADAYILPGVGAFAQGMGNLRALGLLEPLARNVLERGKPVLGICLGMQLLAEESEEGVEDGAEGGGSLHKGLGWIPGRVRRIASGPGVAATHVGWNTLSVLRQDPLFAGLESPCVYFDHGYALDCDASVVSAVCSHGEAVVAAVQRDNIFGVQFHPEKSQAHGLKILRRLFASLGFEKEAAPC
ncbi:imidazole glycerol phosphate synthase subunit hisH [Humidesulfovibrio mexicanus]|uniref:Imidazole glycerol phosphate synthase subunit HisH n=1 Tax=Humidesulfovibrio mexicanus TaxID=147047 RepID=A0A239BV47_9BACT|nr:imidazole glycerol phosphate synthase subunit HisH [Humidesulfovibrio mexicanus]SNS11539.1 imidazole glycerol phosphate synthase subunit hisH [Humidesulfovibrio mexicanus]